MAGEKKIFVDTETTGFHRELDQVLEIALLVEDAQRNQIDSLEIKIKLKENVIPDAKALLVNKINPYSKEWIAEAVTEYEAANLVAAFVKKHQGPGGLKKPVLVAYNADFDKPVVSVFLSRGGHKFKQLFNRSVSDPLITARKLIASGKLKTVEKTFNFRTTQSAKLGDVAAARGITFDGEAHRALTDTKVLQKLTPILFDEAAGLKTGTLLSEPSSYQAGQILNLVTDSKSSGVSVRHVYVLENNPDDEFVVVIDQKDLDENKGFKPSAIRQFNYATILGETEVQSDVAESLRTIAIERADAITPLVKKKHKDSGEEPDYHDEGVEFIEIERLQSLMTDADDKRAMFNRLSDELMDRFGGDKAKTKSVMNRVEQVACAKGLKGWMRDLFYDDRIRLLEHIAGSTTVRVALNPAGNYDVAIAFERGGKRFQERTSCKATKDIQNFLNGKIGKVPEFVEFVGAIPDSDEFKDPKHPSVQIKMLTDAIDEIKVADKNSETSPPKGEAFSESTKAAVTQIIMQFKQPKDFFSAQAPDGKR